MEPSAQANGELNLVRRSLYEVPSFLSGSNSLTRLLLDGNKIASLSTVLSASFGSLLVLTCSGNQISSLRDIHYLSRVHHLDASKNKISEIPYGIGLLHNLTFLHLHDNMISSVPDELQNLVCLRDLSIGGNKITSLPDSMSNLSDLLSLSIANSPFNTQCKSKISILPEWFSCMGGLTSLDVSLNRISSLPSCITSLTKLQKLNLKGNQLRSIVDLTLFPSLTCVCIGQNPLDSVYYALYDSLDLRTKSLRQTNQKLSILNEKLLLHVANLHSPPLSLDYSNNAITKTPECMQRLTSVTRLNLSFNSISSIPAFVGLMISLKDIDLSHNKVNHLPTSFTSLTRLENLNLSYNDISAIPRTSHWPLIQKLSFSFNKIQNKAVWVSGNADLKSLSLKSNKIISFMDIFA